MRSFEGVKLYIKRNFLNPELNKLIKHTQVKVRICV